LRGPSVRNEGYLHDRDDQGRMGTTAIVLVGSLIISMALNVFGDFFVGLIHSLEMELYEDAKGPVGFWVRPAAGMMMMGMMRRRKGKGGGGEGGRSKKRGRDDSIILWQWHLCSTADMVVW
jgi:hypothetical protein